MREITLKTADKVTIRANFYESGRDEVLIICPGWFMTKDSKSLLNLSEALYKNIDVITMDFRGHGRSGGFYTFMAKEEQDLDVVVNFAKEHYKKVSLLGFSLGAGLVLLHCSKDFGICKCIAVSAPTDFIKIENHMYSPHAWIPTLFQKFEPKRWLSIRPGNPFLKKQRPVDVIAKVQTPTLFLSGENDPTVYPWHTELLYKKAICEKAYLQFKKANHAEDLYNDYPANFLKTCLIWLK